MRSSERKESPASDREERNQSPRRSRSRSHHHSHSRHTRDRRSRERPHYDYDDGRNNRNEGNTLYIGNISSHAVEADVKEEFEKIGPVSSIKIPMDKDGYNRGFCFLTFESSADAKQALDERIILHDRILTVELSHRNAGYKPTPGVYLGKQSLSYSRRLDESHSHRYHSDSEDDYRRHHRRRSHSRDYGHSRSRDRSRDRSSRGDERRHRSRSHRREDRDSRR